MDNKELISIIVPVYNVKEYLDKCIESIVNQTYENIEIVIVDDGSSDGSEIKCDEWKKRDSRVVVIHQENRGISAVRNTGIQNAHGVYVCFVDADDYIAVDMVERLYCALIDNSVDIAICGYYECIDDKLIKHFYRSKKMIDPKDYFESIFEGHQIGSYPWNKIYKRELFSDVAYPVGQKYEDVSTTYKLICKCKKIAVITDCLYYYVRHEGSITKSINSKNMWDLINAITEREEYIKSEYPVFNTKVHNQKTSIYISNWNQLAKINNKKYESDMKILRTYIMKNYRKVTSKKYKLMGWLICYMPNLYKRSIAFIYKLK